MEHVEGLVECGGYGHHPLLLRTRRADLPRHGEGRWTSRGWGRFIINSLRLGRFGGLVMENVERLVEGGGHGHHPLLFRTRKANLLFSSRRWQRPWPPSQLSTEAGRKMVMVKFPSLLGVEGQTTSHCKLRHEDQAMGSGHGLRPLTRASLSAALRAHLSKTKQASP